MRARDRRIIVWPWDVPSGVVSDRLTTVAVANPAVESVWLRDAHGAERRQDAPHERHEETEADDARRRPLRRRAAGEEREQTEEHRACPWRGNGHEEGVGQ